MKKLIILLAFTNLIVAQEKDLKNNVSVEKNIFSVQLSAVSLHIADEFKIKNNLTLYSEFGYNLAFHTDKSTDAYRLQTYWAGKFRVEPRFYYNLIRRSEKKKNISNNSGNYFGMSLKYYPKQLSFTNFNELYFFNQFEVGPRYGLKRNIGKSNFNYEFTVAPLLNHQFRKEYGYLKDQNKITLDITLHIGYNFTKKK